MDTGGASLWALWAFGQGTPLKIKMPMGILGIWAKFWYPKNRHIPWALLAFGHDSEYKLKCPWAFWAFGPGIGTYYIGNSILICIWVHSAIFDQMTIEIVGLWA